MANRIIAWSGRVSSTFLDRIEWLAQALMLPAPLGASWLMTCIAFETGGTFSAAIRNMAGSGATGLIQLMPAIALTFFYTPAQIQAMSKEEQKKRGLECCDRLAAMTPEDQLNYVYKYFAPYKGRLHSLEDMYMAILWPAAIGKPMSYVLWDKATRPTAYRQNAGLDTNKDGAVTKEEVCKKINLTLVEGTKPRNMAA